MSRPPRGSQFSVLEKSMKSNIVFEDSIPDVDVPICQLKISKVRIKVRGLRSPVYCTQSVCKKTENGPFPEPLFSTSF